MRVIDRLLTEAEDLAVDKVFYVLLNEHDYITLKKEISSGYVQFDHTNKPSLASQPLQRDGWICLSAGGYTFVVRKVPNTKDKLLSVIAFQ